MAGPGRPAWPLTGTGSPLVRAGAPVAQYFRRYVFVPRYRPQERLTLRTADGLLLTAARLPGPPDAFATVVVVHGLTHFSRTPAVHTFARRLARHLHVLVPDLRGHGGSQGRCSLGLGEPLDVAAAVAAADPDLPVVSVGISMGGSAALLHAGSTGGVAGVVAVSPPAWSSPWESPQADRLRRLVTTPAGRVVLARAMRTRVARRCDPVPDSRAVVAAISPAFTLVVHDPADRYFGPEHAEAIVGWAREPKDLWWVEGGGHGTDILTPPMVERLVGHVRRELEAAGGCR